MQNMDDFTRGALEMQRVAAEALDRQAHQAEAELRTISKGLDRGYTASRLNEKWAHFLAAAAIVRSIKIQDAVKADG